MKQLRFVYLLQVGERNFYTPYSHNLGIAFQCIPVVSWPNIHLLIWTESVTYSIYSMNQLFYPNLWCFCLRGGFNKQHIKPALNIFMLNRPYLLYLISTVLRLAHKSQSIRMSFFVIVIMTWEVNMKLGQRGHTRHCKLADTILTQPFEYKYAWQIGEAKFQILVNLWRTFRL